MSSGSWAFRSNEKAMRAGYLTLIGRLSTTSPSCFSTSSASPALRVRRVTRPSMLLSTVKMASSDDVTVTFNCRRGSLT